MQLVFKLQMQRSKKNILLIVFVLLMLFSSPASLYSLSTADCPHLNKTNLPKGCGSCHKGHGKFNTPMLPEQRNVFCFRCHGHSVNVAKTRKEGDITNNAISSDIQREFEKPYHHPIEKNDIDRYDSRSKFFSDNNSSSPRHVECVDCHHHHFVTKEDKMVGMEGLDGRGSKVESVTSEYQLCFKCHSNSANLPADQTNKAEMFNISNPSFHPVIAPGRNNDVPSLSSPLTVISLIKCTSCHNNNDVLGIKGPHGSQYKHILARNFTEDDGPEGSTQYALCYGCHRRTSILANESFRYHKLHISQVGASCRTCHNPHGSTRYRHLIDFDNNVISLRPSSSGRFEYTAFGYRAGQCYLNCHGKDHNPGEYPTSSSKPSSLSSSQRSSHR